MPNNQLGKLRRSAAVMTFGPGSVIDFRADGAPISAVAAGLEEWDKSFPPAGLANPQQITEPRLQKKLSVNGFRLPPVVDEDRRDNQGRPDNRSLVASRFPEWLQCPSCDRLAPSRRWSADPGRAYRYCADCSRKKPSQRKVFAVPIRFVMACSKGHLDDFPWHFWVGHRANCNKKERADLRLRSEGPGLGGLVVSCRECNAQRSMDGVFSANTWRGTKCRGRKPWLGVSQEDCDREPRVLQRGASNLYFPVIASALSIPPWSDQLQEALGLYWAAIVNTEPNDRAAFIRVLGRGDLKHVLRNLGLTPEELARIVEERLAKINSDDILNIRQEEYRQFDSKMDTNDGDAREFEVRNVPVPVRLQGFLSRVVRVVRLREVRALRGFTRINPPGDEESPDIAAISLAHLEWLPAVEVRGEGIFLAFNRDALHLWETRNDVVARAKRIENAARVNWEMRYGDRDPVRQITPRFLLAHGFAHALMRQLTLESGYSTAALRERLYVSETEEKMAGILIYTATSDSDGTLGGLQRQGEVHRIERAIEAAIHAMEWCSCDPLCIEGMLAGSDALSLAACHACLLAPETACEEYNQFLDRVALVGLPDYPDLGYFSPLINGR